MTGNGIVESSVLRIEVMDSKETVITMRAAAPMNVTIITNATIQHSIKTETPILTQVGIFPEKTMIGILEIMGIAPTKIKKEKNMKSETTENEIYRKNTPGK